jgi:NADPH:quinone reductase-like Zn-dependent oxidoreductase
MRAVTIVKQANPVTPNVRFVHDYPDCGEPGRGAVRVRTLASAFNHMDLWVGRGIPGVDIAYPHVGGCDACGVVESVGEGVDAAWVGKRVVVNAAQPVVQGARPTDPSGHTLAPDYRLIGEHSPGMHRERFLAPAESLADVGDADPVHAAAFGLCTLTAYSMIVTKADVKPGALVLITGIGGGVATAALAICRHMRCRVAVTSRHEAKIARAVALGAELGVLDQGQDWSREVRTWTGKRGVDIAVDSSGKATHLNCIKSLARGGTYVTPGCTSGPDATTDLARIFWNQLRVMGSTMGTNDEFKQVVALFRAGAIAPIVDTVLPADAARDAYARLEAGEQFGKLVLTWT